MDKLYVLMCDDTLMGVFTEHRKATQALIIDVTSKEKKLVEYSYDFGIEFFTYHGPVCTYVYSIHEVTPDERV